jgi:C-terminal processing protease CtpA/Prc
VDGGFTLKIVKQIKLFSTRTIKQLENKVNRWLVKEEYKKINDIDIRLDKRKCYKAVITYEKIKEEKHDNYTNYFDFRQFMSGSDDTSGIIKLETSPVEEKYNDEFSYFRCIYGNEDDPLSDKQKKFVEYYVMGKTVEEAATNAGYSKNYKAPSTLLKYRKIIKAIRERREKQKQLTIGDIIGNKS